MTESQRKFIEDVIDILDTHVSKSDSIWYNDTMDTGISVNNFILCLRYVLTSGDVVNYQEKMMLNSILNHQQLYLYSDVDIIPIQISHKYKSK